MRVSRLPQVTAIVTAFLAIVSFSRCSDPVTPGGGSLGSAAMAKGSAKPGGGTTTVAVTAATPNWGIPGASDEEVVISGSGFEAPVQVAWERGGVADPKITVQSAVVESSTSIRARISISGDAGLALYDVSVTLIGKGKRGVGTELYEVTTTPKGKDVGSTFYIHQDNSLGMTGDGKLLEPAGSPYAGHSRYKNSECGTMSLIKTWVGETGDALMSSSYTGSRGCRDAPRKIRIAHDRIDPATGNTTSEGVLTTVTFMNVRKLQKAATSDDPGTAIPIGTSEFRSMAFSDESYKCGAAGTGPILFSPVTTDGFETGANNVRVTRLSAYEWLVETLPDEVVGGTVIHNDAAWCRGNGQLYHMPLRLIIRSSVGLP